LVLLLVFAQMLRGTFAALGRMPALGSPPLVLLRIYHLVTGQLEA